MCSIHPQHLKFDISRIEQEDVVLDLKDLEHLLRERVEEKNAKDFSIF